MADTKRDPSVGAEWLAWWALQGDEPLECVLDYLEEAEEELGKLIAENDRLSRADDNFLSGLHLVLIGLAGAIRGEGETVYKLEFKRARRGKPINTHERALHGRKVAGWVESEISAGKQQEQAVLEAVELFDLSRAEIFSWLASRRRWLASRNSSNNQD
ncbi:hypothetical protein [Altericroceibacterium xinjiangense]|uniref:hypothetical protein n=1 Tax=Altericroceibacterium xinjiangense TaxID=762261 RepID=UPI000F7EE1F3|nr:hypothetical protein [Altericroceibacterium xinjiangense]